MQVDVETPLCSEWPSLAPDPSLAHIWELTDEMSRVSYIPHPSPVHGDVSWIGH